MKKKEQKYKEAVQRNVSKFFKDMKKPLFRQVFDNENGGITKDKLKHKLGIRITDERFDEEIASFLK